MVFSKEQAEQIKQQLLAQIEQLPNENKEQIKQHIQTLDEAGLEEFLKQQNIRIGGGPEEPEDSTQPQQPDQCIFCSIIEGKISSYKIAENDKAIAILEINPVSRGHSIVIPKEHLTTDKIPKSTLTLAHKIAKRIKKKLKAEDIKIETSALQGHTFINIIPFFKDEKVEKRKASEEELAKLQHKLETKKRASRIKKEKAVETKNLKDIGFRIP